MRKTLPVTAVLILSVLLLTAAALASGSHDCADTDGDHLCDECWETITANCTDADGDHGCDVCFAPVRTHCADADGDEWCDVCGQHMSQRCTDADGNHACDVCWAALSTCLDANKNHLCDICGGVFWVDENADGLCDGCEAVLTHVTAGHKGVYYHTAKDGTTVVDVAIEVTVQPYVEDVGIPAGTVSVHWTDENGKVYATAEKALTFGETTAVVEYPALPARLMETGGRVVFSPYDAGFTPAENGCVAEYDLPALWIGSDAEYTVNGVRESKLFLLPGTKVTVVQQPGLTDSWEWVFEDGCAVPEITGDGLTATFLMPEESVNLYAAWRCEVCADADGDFWCDVCQYYVAPIVADDVDTDAWYADAASFAVENGLMELTGEGLFAPAGAVTRGDFICALRKMDGGTAVGDGPNFSDVAPDDLCADAVRWAAEQGVALGYPDGTFRPGQVITRQEMAAFLYRYEQTLGGGFTGMWMFLLDCTDRFEVAEWAYEPLCWLTMNGVVNGDGTGALKPKDTATRAEMAQILKNFMER